MINSIAIGSDGSRGGREEEISQNWAYRRKCSEE